VVHIGCGLDSRFERVEWYGRVEWYDLDLPEVLAPIFRLFKPTRIFHFQLGEAGG